VHQEAFCYVRDSLARFVPTPGNVLELGSFNVNGTVRDLFTETDGYTGVDLRGGRGVDVVCDASDYDGVASFDTVVTAEMLEHARRPQAVIESAWRALKPGGVLILTAASQERLPHNNNGDHVLDDDEHYAGINPDDLADWLTDWEVLSFEHHPGRGDVYATARKAC